jgi:hypothetical protein
MSLKRQPHKTTPVCPTGKAYFSTQGRALRRAVSIHMENAQAAVPAEVEPGGAYRCDACGGWHLTVGKGEVSLGR